MTVKSIFKVLIGTISTIVVASLIVEVFNVSTTGLQINQISKMAGKQACTLFSQESYKAYNSGGGAVAMDNVVDENGNVYVEGDFYGETDPKQIYNNLYTSDDFKNWLQSEAATKGNWYNIKLIDKALNHADSLNIEYGQPGYDEAMVAKLYKDVMMTPSNLGVPYIDMETVNKMFRWNVAQLFSNCNPKSILVDDNGERYVSFKGFRVYANMASITNLEYKTFDLEDSADRLAFNNLTNINPDNLGFMYDSNLATTINSREDERKRVCVVGVNFDIPIAYEGITPIRSIFNYVWDNEVEGINGNSGRTSYEQWVDRAETLSSGGLYGNTQADDVLPIPGKLIYYIIR